MGCMGPTVEAEQPVVVWHAYRGQEEVALVHGETSAPIKEVS